MEQLQSNKFAEFLPASKFSYAMAFVPAQPWDEAYEPEVALMRGTLFPSLDKPFIGEEAVPNA